MNRDAFLVIGLRRRYIVTYLDIHLFIAADCNKINSFLIQLSNVNLEATPHQFDADNIFIHLAISVSLAEGGSNDESNLMSLCRSCHEKMHRERGDR